MEVNPGALSEKKTEPFFIYTRRRKRLQHTYLWIFFFLLGHQSVPVLLFGIISENVRRQG
jgi:hypothetical protein